VPSASVGHVSPPVAASAGPSPKLGPSPSPRTSLGGGGVGSFVGRVSPLPQTLSSTGTSSGSLIAPRLSLSAPCDPPARRLSDTYGEASIAAAAAASLAAAATQALQPDSVTEGGDAPPSSAALFGGPPGGPPGGARGIHVQAETGSGGPYGIELASIVEGPQSYFLGIIDVLQRWDLRKRVERFLKTWGRCANRAGISALPPADYAQRFADRVIYDVFDAPVEPEVEAAMGTGPSPSFRDSAVHKSSSRAS